MLKVQNLIGFGVGGSIAKTISIFDVNDVAYSSNADGGGSTITVPNGVIAGDVIIVRDLICAGTLPSAVTPSGFTLDSNLSFSNTNQARGTILHKIATGSEGGTTLTLMATAPASDDITSKELLIVRGSLPITAVGVSTPNTQGTSGNPNAQNVAASGGVAPLIVLGAYSDAIDGPSLVSAGSVGTRSFSPAKDAEVSGYAGSYLAYKIYNSSPADVSIDMNDEGNVNLLQSLYMQFTM